MAQPRTEHDDLRRQGVAWGRAHETLSDTLDNLGQSDQIRMLFALLAERGVDLTPPKTPRKRAPRRTTAPVPARRVSGGNMVAKLVMALRASPRAPISALAATIYGETSDATTNRIRSLLALAKRADLVRNVGVGAWEVTDTK